MFGTSSSEAVSGYVASIQAAIGCITAERVRATGYRHDVPSLALVFSRGLIASLGGGVEPLGLDFRQFYRLEEDRTAARRQRWRVDVAGYHYALISRQTDHEMLAFHWHPQVAAKPFPHVHLETGLEPRRDLVGIHVPTGPLQIEDVIRFAIEELGVRPRVPNWASVLEQTRAARADQP